MTRILWSRIQDGHWEAELESQNTDPPIVELVHQGESIAEAPAQAAEGQDKWRVRLELPAHLMSDRVQTCLVRLRGQPEPLCRFAVLAGDALEGDIFAELEALRAELDLLGRAFRRHCRETGAS
ncbi:hypothetical protein LV82_00345 [Albidovulum inexpectatum]|uniref:Uncharacterized protein n=1 Tax=Albidovulum inexpectatum TaxID=196587 RepID=A0A2S5JME2_9RHOB|nr:hypothetical protein [Albidovulum inexpectatum]PPB82415.1 hypothetical protein LV82_00345 [Albidovulum inexpectatum]